MTERTKVVRENLLRAVAMHKANKFTFTPGEKKFINRFHILDSGDVICSIPYVGHFKTAEEIPTKIVNKLHRLVNPVWEGSDRDTASHRYGR